MRSMDALVSVVVPFLNERENLPVLVERLGRVFVERTERWELLLVDDGSEDGSTEWVRSRCGEVPESGGRGRIRLVRLLRQEIADGHFRPFDGPVYDQSGVMRIAPGEQLTPDSILHMDWLADNVVGEIPAIDRLAPEALELHQLPGVKEDEKEE